MIIIVKSIGFTKEILEMEYIENKLTHKQIAVKYNCSERTVETNCKKYGIKEENKKESYKITDLQYDLIIGGLLGDGCVTKNKDNKNARYHEKHSEEQSKYCNFKLHLLSNLCNQTELRVYKNIVEGKTYFQPNFTTKCLPCFNEFIDMTIIDKLEKLNSNSFSIWMMDDGHLFKHGDVYKLTMARFTKDELSYAMNLINSRFELNSYYLFKDRKNDVHEGLRFPAKDTLRIKEILKNCDFGKQLQETMPDKFFR